MLMYERVFFICLRAHWLLSLRREWEASQTNRAAKKQVAKWHARRSSLERLFDDLCMGMLEVRDKSWIVKS